VDSPVNLDIVDIVTPNLPDPTGSKPQPYLVHNNILDAPDGSVCACQAAMGLRTELGESEGLEESCKRHELSEKDNISRCCRNDEVGSAALSAIRRSAMMRPESN